jgi:hypothetical protein
MKEANILRACKLLLPSTGRGGHPRGDRAIAILLSCVIQRSSQAATGQGRTGALGV